MIDIPVSDAPRRIRRVVLGDFVHRSALKFPERTAVVDGDVRLTHAELDARSSRFGHWLLKTIGSGKQVGLLCQNSADMVVAYNGIHKSANVWVPANIRLDASTIEYVLRHAEVSAVVVDKELRADPALAAVLDKLGVPLILTLNSDGGSGNSSGVTTLAAAESGQDVSLPEIDLTGQEPALIMYTSGTTGNPKGAVHSHASVAAAVMGNMSGFEITHEDVFSGVLPLYHCAQHCLVATVHAAGGCVVMLRGFVPDEVRASIRKEKYTAFTGLPMMYGALLADPAFRCDDSMRLAIYAMAPIPGPLIKQIAARMTSNVQLATGQTEMYPGTMTFRPLDHPDLDANYWGISLPHNETAVMDDNGNLLGEGQPGEIVHRGANAMLGYLKDPEATAAAQQFGWHHTGDLGMWGPAGQLLFLDRKKDMIKSGGENVASVKIESVILAHPAVAGVGVIGLPHPRWSEAVCAFVVRKPDVAVEEADIEAHCREHLGDFEVPKLIRFVDGLPATSTGKVQKHVLRKQFARLAEEAWVRE